MKRATALLVALSVAGCATHRPNPNSATVIYAIPQSEAFAMAHQAIESAPRRDTLGEYRVDAIRDRDATHDQIIGYRLVFHGWHYFNTFTQNLYVIPVAGLGASGQEVDGFRFLIAADGRLPVHLTGYWSVDTDFVHAAAQDTSLAETLNAALDSRGKTALVTNVRMRPYDEGRER